MSTLIFPILQMRKQRFREAKHDIVQRHAVSKWQEWDSNWDTLTPQPDSLTWHAQFSLCKPGLDLLVLKWVKKQGKYLEGQIYPAVSNIWDFACQHGNLFVCKLLWVALLSPFTGCLLCILYKGSSVNFWILGSSWMVCITAFALCWRRCHMFLNLTQVQLSGYRLGSWHRALRFSFYHVLLHPTVMLVTF